MTNKFNVGDRVAFNTQHGKIKGKIIRQSIYSSFDIEAENGEFYTKPDYDFKRLVKKKKTLEIGQRVIVKISGYSPWNGLTGKISKLIIDGYEVELDKASYPKETLLLPLDCVKKLKKKRVTFKVGDRVRVTDMFGIKHTGHINHLYSPESYYELTFVRDDKASWDVHAKDCKRLVKREFKLGDKVRVLCGEKNGYCGTIIDVITLSNRFLVRLHDEYSAWYLSKDLMHIYPKPPLGMKGLFRNELVEKRLSDLEKRYCELVMDRDTSQGKIRELYRYINKIKAI